ncbi:MAG: hypothetical protein ACREQA_24305 [Candidatus Binatia bacterium]
MIYPSDPYAQTLRAIGQSLELLHIESFDLESRGNDYLVRGKASAPPRDIQEKVLWVFWRLKDRNPEQTWPSPQAVPEGFGLLYTPEQIDRLENKGRARRHDPHGMPDASSVSQILRATGAYLDAKGARPLGISRREQEVTVRYETTEGRGAMEEHALSFFHDFGSRMCGDRQ